MKKISLIVLLFLAATQMADAQLALGVRGALGFDGNAYGGAEISFQNIDRFEADLGWMNDSWKLTGLALHSFIKGRSLGLYAGIGAGVGYNENSSNVFLTLAADIGFYLRLLRFIQLGVDWRPEWAVINAPGNDFTSNVALSIRFIIGR